jgi:outer membrane protein OmpA-like peptidoglycan-associated protein
MKRFTLPFVALGLAALGMTACASTEAVRYDEVDNSGDNRTRIDIEKSVSGVCDLPRNTAFFGFDATTLDDSDKQTLQRVADCMKDGALKDEQIVVLGLTDTHGSKAYNEELGMNRSEMVAKYLVEHCGVEEKRVYLKSFGEERATGADALDRRVEIRVAERK